ncbi:DinB family protein [Nonomuraea candida]|uniref:DinB family protein n=1 Tax=Nonomuraea candida TaxID=359159 RepID=UPI0005B969EF|nr:DinB family protein [Nonomuraea candida]
MTWHAPEITRRIDPLSVVAADERAVADLWLELHRETLLWKCGGLSAEQLKSRCVEPSNLSLLGLLRHMAEVERDWFRTRFAGERVAYLYCSDDRLNAEFDDVDEADAEADYATYLRELDAVRETVANRPFDETFLDPRRGIVMSLRWVHMAMVQEYSRHNGHADLLRERTDGATGH